MYSTLGTALDGARTTVVGATCILYDITNTPHFCSHSSVAPAYALPY